MRSRRRHMCVLAPHYGLVLALAVTWAFLLFLRHVMRPCVRMITRLRPPAPAPARDLALALARPHTSAPCTLALAERVDGILKIFWYLQYPYPYLFADGWFDWIDRAIKISRYVRARPRSVRRATPVNYLPISCPGAASPPRGFHLKLLH